MYTHPFDYGYDDNYTYTSLMTQRQASFKETKKEEYVPKNEDIYDFYGGTDIPTPAIEEIDGYKPEKEIDETSTETASEIVEETNAENTETETSEEVVTE